MVDKNTELRRMINERHGRHKAEARKKEAGATSKAPEKKKKKKDKTVSSIVPIPKRPTKKPRTKATSEVTPEVATEAAQEVPSEIPINNLSPLRFAPSESKLVVSVPPHPSRQDKGNGVMG